MRRRRHGPSTPVGPRSGDDATHPQHNEATKTAILPQVRVEPQLRADAESVLHEGETLSEFVETTVRSAVEYRRVQAEFQARAQAAWQDHLRTGQGTPAEEVVADLRARLEVRRQRLKGKHRPAA